MSLKLNLCVTSLWLKFKQKFAEEVKFQSRRFKYFFQFTATTEKYEKALNLIIFPSRGFYFENPALSVSTSEMFGIKFFLNMKSTFLHFIE